jgi:probable phosphoglycerate mutase
MFVNNTDIPTNGRKNIAHDLGSPISTPRTRQTAETVNQYHDALIDIHPYIFDMHSGFDGRTVDEYFVAIARDPLNAYVNGGKSLLDH